MQNLKSTIVNKVLGYYFINPQARHYTRDLARVLNLDPGNLSRKMIALVNDGLFISEGEGRNRYFKLNRQFPYLKEYKKIYESENGVELEIKKALQGASGLEEVYIFGSYAKGNFSAGSDIDLLLIGNHDIDEAARKINVLEKRWGREINVIDLSRQEFNKRKKNKDFLLLDIFNNKTIKII